MWIGAIAELLRFDIAAKARYLIYVNAMTHVEETSRLLDKIYFLSERQFKVLVELNSAHKGLK